MTFFDFPRGAAAVVFASLWLTGCTSAPVPTAPDGARHEPLNLSQAKAAVVAYYDSGDYARDMTSVANDAAAWINTRAAARAPGEKLAVVFDIDETVLTSYPQMLRQDFGYSEEPWSAWLEAGDAKALVPVREVYRAAKAQGIEVFFVTGRAEPGDRAATEKNLRREDMGNYARLVMKPAEAKGLKAAGWKASVRRGLTEGEGWVIVASIGDQESDLAGGFAERTFKLPNPCYEIQ
jgi:predicted secreted acid phosphatase